MPVTFKVAKMAERAQADPALYEILRDIGVSGGNLAAAINSMEVLIASLSAAVGSAVGGTLFPFFLASGAYSPITLTASHGLPFYLASGVRSDISTV